MLRRALELDPRSMSAHMLIGRSWQEQGDWLAARQWYERALRIDPLNPQALDLLAMAYARERRYAEALPLYRALEEISPDNAQTHANVGAALYQLGRLQEALESLERAGPEPGPGSDPHHPGSGAQAPPAAVAIYADPQKPPIPSSSTPILPLVPVPGGDRVLAVLLEAAAHGVGKLQTAERLSNAGATIGRGFYRFNLGVSCFILSLGLFALLFAGPAASVAAARPMAPQATRGALAPPGAVPVVVEAAIIARAANRAAQPGSARSPCPGALRAAALRGRWRCTGLGQNSIAQQIHSPGVPRGRPATPLTRGAKRRFNAGVDVANPIYDVVFKYLMQNDRVARLLIGRITGLAVQSLTVSPQETAVRRTPDAPARHLPLTLLRMDFAARVQTPDGSERQVLIEIQKTSAPTVIERFRRYLGQQIGSSDNILTHPSGRTEAVPIVTIYFLGYALDELSDEAVIDVCPRVTERRTGRELEASHPLVEGIHHRSHIIQIPRLASRRRDELERLLAIFDQGLVKGNGRGDAHVLTIEEGDYPAECAFVLRQLREAMAEEDVRRNMEGEDLLLRDSILLARQVEHRDRLLAQERQQAEQERQRAQRAEQAQQQAEQERQQAEQERRVLLAQAIRHLHGLGQDVEAIAAALAVDADEVRRVLSG